MSLHPAVTSILEHFDYDHLPPHLQRVSKRFGELAEFMAGSAGDDPETTAGLRKLLEAKDCAVRAVVRKTKNEG